MPPVEAVELTQVLHALSDPVRLEIGRRRLAADGGVGLLGLPAAGGASATRSHHFRVLRDAGMTTTRVVGTKRLVSLRVDELAARFPGLLESVLPPPSAAA